MARWGLGEMAGWSLLILLAGCATTSHDPAIPLPQAIPTLQGSYHLVAPGETLWRVARAYGLEPRTLASVNRLPSVGQLKVGQRLFIPLPLESSQFLWPVRGARRTPRTSYGVEIAAPTGSLVRVSRTGRVAVATQQLSGWGKTIVVDHLDGYLSVYTWLQQILVSPGVTLRQGTPLGSVGVQPLHFEIRYGAIPKDTLALLPNE